MKDINHTDREHALLSASSSNRWLKCPASARIEDTLPDTTSDAAAEGTLAHEYCELDIRKTYIEPMGARTYNARVKKIQAHELYKPEMRSAVEMYDDYIAGIMHSYPTAPLILVEQRVDYTMYAPEGFGTSDCTIVHGENLHVIDFKYGKGHAVSAIDNPQLKLYALGMYHNLSFLYPIKQIHMVIVQPRNGGITEHTISLEELLAWGEIIKPIAQVAFDGTGEQVCGEHCTFCRALAICRTTATKNMSLFKHELAAPSTLSNAEIGLILADAQDLAKWVKKVEEYALAQTLAGNEIPGWKAVEGRGSRVYTNTDNAMNRLLAGGVEEALLYERKPITLAATETMLGKTRFRELVGDLVESAPGKPTLVPLSDKREPFKRQSAQDDFKNLVENQEVTINE